MYEREKYIIRAGIRNRGILSHSTSIRIGELKKYSSFRSFMHLLD